MQFPEITLRKILGLIITCLVVGFVMSFLGIRPATFWRWMVSLAETLYDVARSLFANGLDYLIIGAAVVVPIYAVVYLSKALRKKR